MNRGRSAVVLLAIPLLINACAHPAAHPGHPLPPARASPTPIGASAHVTVDRLRPFPRDLPAGTPRGLTAVQRTVDRRSADAVSAAFVVRLELWDTELDRRPNDAARRAAEYATPELRSRMLAAEPDGVPGARWTQLDGHHGWTTVTTRLGGLGGNPPSSATGAMRAVTPRSVDHGSDGWTSYPEPGGTYLVVLHRSGMGQPWAVSSYTIQ